MKAAPIGAGQIARQYLPCLNALPGIRAGRHLHGYLAAQGQKLGRAPPDYWSADPHAVDALGEPRRRLRPGGCRPELRLKPLRFKNRGLRETLGWTPPFDDLQCPTRTYGAAAPRGAGR